MPPNLTIGRWTATTSTPSACKVIQGRVRFPPQALPPTGGQPPNHMIQTDRFADVLVQVMEENGDDHALYDYAEAHFQQIGLLERAYADLPAYEAA